MVTLADLEKIVARALGGLSILHVPILMLIALLRGEGEAAQVGIAALLFALLPQVVGWMGYSARIVGYALAIGLVSQTSLLVHVMAGHPWQAEMHFYYFAVLAMMSGFCDWRLLVATAALIAGHYLALCFTFPHSLLPGAVDLLRVGVHALIVAIETAVLVGVAFLVRFAFEGAHIARGEAERAASDLQKLNLEREKDLIATRAQAQQDLQSFEHFKREVSEAVAALHGAAKILESNADSLTTAATRASAQSETVSVLSEKTALQVGSVARSGEALAQTIAEVGASAAASSDLAASALAEVEQTSRTVGEMAAVAVEIGTVTGLISSITEQTNLLALNATIEAARAGAAGRGFAVVAQEVKSLSAETANATKDIARRIEAMQSTATRSVNTVQQILGTIRELDKVSELIAKAVEEQAAAASNIGVNVTFAARGVEQVHQSIAEIDRFTGVTASAIHEVTAAAFDVTRQTERILERVGRFEEQMLTTRGLASAKPRQLAA